MELGTPCIIKGLTNWSLIPQQNIISVNFITIIDSIFTDL